MKKIFFTFAFVISSYFLLGQVLSIKEQKKVQEDFNNLITIITQHYTYFDKKEVDSDCLKKHYSNQIKNLKNKEEIVFFFESVINEFYDSHMILNTNNNMSFRLYSPFYVSVEGEKIIISNVWQTQINPIKEDVIGAEVLQINDVDFQKAIHQFPSKCNNKKSLVVKEWIANKIIAGQYNQPRILTLKLKSKKILKIDIDKIKLLKPKKLLSYRVDDNIGIIRINNSLGNNNLITIFDKVLDTLISTKGLILDLRNTVDGGNSYVAKGIMSRFIDKELPYQKHQTKEKHGNNPEILRSWIEYVSPRGIQYKKPVMVLVGRWTGSMGEGLAIGFDAIKRGRIIGTEMERLGGEIGVVSLKNYNFGVRIPVVKLFHTNGKLREEFIPEFYIKQKNLTSDNVLKTAIKLLHN